MVGGSGEKSKEEGKIRRNYGYLKIYIFLRDRSEVTERTL